MNTFKTPTILLAAWLALPLAATAASMSKEEYGAAKDRIEAQYKADRDACAPLKGNANDVCMEQAKAKEKLARAELAYSQSGKASDQNKVLVTRAETTYAVAKEMCDDKSGNDKDVCLKEAKAAESKALADAKASNQIGEARSEAADDKRDADYKVAIERCDALAGDAKSACVASAKSRFGKH
jgi:membrane-associated HD superfamily phosphohydrolase